ncbi:MAG: hypothetical protein D6761_03545 [Candidatus Dadabacteria bacterium]|nr:MAG: hypothetical protein D6761_03545 [Candidatus Dadabacteria bacterium]
MATVDLIVAFEPDIHGLAMSAFRMSAQDPDVRAAYEERMQDRRSALRSVVSLLADRGMLDTSLPVEQVVDVLWASTIPPAYELFVVERAWSHEQYRSMIQRLAGAFLRGGH